jgi:hypothetical protein
LLDGSGAADSQWARDDEKDRMPTRPRKGRKIFVPTTILAIFFKYAKMMYGLFDG